MVLAHAGVSPEHPVQVIEVCELADAVFRWGDPKVAEAKATVLASDLLVIASPVFKASYTGLLKAFLDQFGRDELKAVATVPLMVGAAPAHALAVELALRPVLIEIGASCPTRGVYLLEGAVDQAKTELAEWLSVYGDALVAVAHGR